jgi:hypothetical protein
MNVYGCLLTAGAEIRVSPGRLVMMEIRPLVNIYCCVRPKYTLNQHLPNRVFS